MATNDTEPFVSSSEMLPRDVLEVRENTAATWSYHLAHEDTPHEALCGERVMGTGIELHQWGSASDDPPMFFCDECERIAIQKAREGAW
jgi:hypothetical protein